jgi:hypothetical protein
MPTNEEPKLKEDQAAVAELETEESALEDTETIAGGGGPPQSGGGGRPSPHLP